MWHLREIVLWSLLTIPVICPDNIAQIQDNTNDKIINTISDTPQDTTKINTINFNSIKTEKISDLKKSPLFMEWTNRHIWEFLWYNQYDSICMKYNNCYFDENNTSKDKKIYNFEEINFPLIYEWLDTVLPNTVWELLEQDFLQQYRKDLEKHQDIIIIKEVWDNYALRFYKDWKLYLATHVSIWRWNMTPKWLYHTGYKIAKHKSTKYNNAAMPYAINLKWNYFMHQWKVTWKKLSHWCVRVPWLYQKIIYESSKKWTPVIIN